MWKSYEVKVEEIQNDRLLPLQLLADRLRLLRPILET